MATLCPLVVVEQTWNEYGSNCCRILDYPGSCQNRKNDKIHLLVSVRTNTSSFVIFGAIIIGTIVEGASLSHRSAPPLVHKVPFETREGSVLCALALYKKGTLFDAKFLQVSGMAIQRRTTHY